jgi:geranylgeranyl diphosphate synthase type 3
MDDVEDNSELRRGEPVAHTIYGVPQTINTANYVYFLAIQELLTLRSTSGAAAGASMPNDIVKGRGDEKDNDLIRMVTGAFCSLFRSCCLRSLKHNVVR